VYSTSMPQSGRRPQHQKRTQRRQGAMSALPPKADKEQTCRHVRFVSIDYGYRQLTAVFRGAAHWAKCETVHKNTKHWSAMMETRTCALVQPKEDYHVWQILLRICYCCGVGFADARCERQSG